MHTSGRSRRWLRGCAILAVVLVAVLTWRMWPRDPGPVARQVSDRELLQAERVEHASLTLLGGGSKAEAHRLWDYYRDRPAFQGVKPRLLGISRVQLGGGTLESDGIYWLVFSDHVYQPSFGPGGGGGYGRQVVLVPDGSKSVSGDITTF